YSNNIGSSLFDHGERVSGGADRLIGHDGNAKALRNLTQGIEVIGRGGRFKQFNAGCGEEWQEEEGSKAVPAGIDVDAEGDAAVEGIDKLCNAGDICCWIA